MSNQRPHIDLDQELVGPVLLIMRVRDFTDEIGWIHESHPTFASAQEKKQQIEQMVAGAKLLHDAGWSDAWDGWHLSLPFGPWDELHARHVKELSIWARVSS